MFIHYFKKLRINSQSIIFLRYHSSNKNFGKKIFHKALIKNNVDTVFGISGGSIMPLIDSFYDSKIKLIVNSNEQCVGHSATGYSKTSNKVGIAIVTSGPGITNMITPLLDATNDSTPLIVFSGQVPLSAQGTNAFQEAPAVDLTKHVTKWSYQITDINEMPYVIDEAFNIATEGKCGAVHIDIPKCISYQKADSNEKNFYIERKKIMYNIKKSIGYGYDYDYNNELKKRNHYKNYITSYDDINYDYKKIGDLINNSKKPLFYIGQGCKKSSELLTRMALFANIPVTTTIHGNGIFDETNELSLRWCGMHGYAPANYALQEADLIIAIGSRFDDRTTGSLDKYAPEAVKASKKGKGGIIHCNINPHELDFVVKSDYNFCMDSGEFIKKILPFIRVRDRYEWKIYLNNLKEQFPFKMKQSKSKLHIEHVLSKLNKKTQDKDVIFTTGVGNHQMQTYQFIESQYPGKIISSGSLGVMGAGLPYAIGAKLANPDKMVICVDGDGSFNMTLNDLKTIAEYNIPVKIAIMNNNAQMMVTIWEKLFFDDRYTATISEKNPNYVKLADSFGIKSICCSDPKYLNEQLDYFLDFEGPILMEFKIERDICLPLVKPGCALDDMILPGEEDFEDIKIEGDGGGLVPS
jgi:acetolactate synthase I/II/III large subunit